MHLLGQPRLNFDVLRLVCHSLTHVSDALSFALTCSALTEDAFRRRLSMSPVHLSTEESIDGFYRFIFAKEVARAPYIYGLKLPDPEELYDFGPYDPQFRTLNDRLVTILQAATHLEYIYFPTTANCDPVFTVVANMTSLRELSFFFMRDSPWKFLSTFRSSLRSLDIEEGDIDDEGVTAMLLHNHLTNFAPTLEVLKLENYCDVDITPSFVTTQFTAVRSLTIGNVFDFNQSTIEILLRLFPGLDGTLVLGTLHITQGEVFYPNWREANKDVQKTRAWPRLDRVVCEADGVFLMAIQCPIRHMETRVPRHHWKRYLAPALRHNYPQRLHCVVKFFDGLGDLDGELFPSEGADRLTHLSMVAELRVGWPEVRITQAPWPQFRDKLIASMSHLRLTHLRLVLQYDVLQDDPESDPTLLYTAGEADLQPAATELAKTIPTLQYVFLITCRQKRKYISHRTSPSLGPGRYETTQWLSSKGWRVVRHRGEHHPDLPSVADAEVEASCAELSSSAADRIIEQEELYLLPYEEHLLRDFNDPTA